MVFYIFVAKALMPIGEKLLGMFCNRIYIYSREVSVLGEGRLDILGERRIWLTYFVLQ